MPENLLLTSLIATSLAMAVPSFATTKSMECERYQIGTDSLKSSLFIYIVTANFDTELLEIKLTKKPEENQAGDFPFPLAKKWKIFWHSPNLMRTVALIDKFSNNLFDSAVMLIDADFANVRMRYWGAGGMTDFDTVINDPWKYECKRID